MVPHEENIRQDFALQAGTNPDISSDTYPNNYTIGPHGIGIFSNTSPRINWAGMRIAKNGYIAVYLAWDYHYAGGSTVIDPIETEVLGNILLWLTGDDI